MSNNLLYIYDADDSTIGDGPHGGGNNVHKLGISGGEKGLRKALDGLVGAGKTFSRVLWQTHGKAGKIGFGGDSLPYFYWKSPQWVEGQYWKLFPFATKMYFDGCNVADSEDGWRFLEEAGKLFLWTGGGVVFGWTSYGINIWSFVPLIGGHTVHFWGDTRYVEIARGGAVARRYTSELTPRERREIRGNVGNKI